MPEIYRDMIIVHKNICTLARDETRINAPYLYHFKVRLPLN